jgi:rhodanese-related sulfurtransferase
VIPQAPANAGSIAGNGWIALKAAPPVLVSASSISAVSRAVPIEEVLMTTSVKQLMEAANAAVPKITPAQAREMIATGNTLVVDVRDAPEVEKSGKIAGAVNVSRGMLEFRADPESPYHDKNFSRDKTVILYCASGGRSALSGKVLKDMGYSNVYNVGGFKDWADSGGAIERAA